MDQRVESRVIVTERLILRPFEPRDTDAFAAINADPEVMRYFPSTLTPEETVQSLERNAARVARQGFSFSAAELRATGEFAGFLGLAVPDFDVHFMPCVEIGWRLAARFWNRGLATEGALACLEFAWNQLGLKEVVAYTTQSNAPSRRVMEKIGMTYDPAGDFIYPRLPQGHPLGPQVLYRIAKPAA
jgi:RimJ/RimL family protein N-acetyltransferase